MFILLSLIGILYASGSLRSVRIEPSDSDVDLTGAWKIAYHDDPSFRGLQIDDTAWCDISVPDAGRPVTDFNSSLKPVVGCPTERYPRELMQMHTYWYRTWVTIPSGAHWEKPSLFLGAIKEEYWVYWDNEFISWERLERAPAVLLLSSQQVLPGKHLLAIRVRSGQNENPGLYHAIKRRVALGEYSKSIAAIDSYRWGDSLEPFAIAIVHVIALLLLLFFTVRSAVVSEREYWLIIYFGSAVIFSCAVAPGGRLQAYFHDCAYLGMSLALTGLGISISGSRTSFLLRRAVLVAGVLLLSIYTAGALLNFYPPWLRNLHRITISTSLIYLCVSQVLDKQLWSRRSRDWGLIGTLVVIHFAHFLDRVVFANSAVYFHVGAISALLTLVVVALAIDDQILQQRQLAFFGRFVRPGLKDFLGLFRKRSAIAEVKHFRGRKIPVMKVDIVDSTRSYYGMPFGAKRLLQDLWYTHVDHVVQPDIFLDRPEGDGSNYYFREDLPKGSCLAAWQAALRIRGVALKEFDLEYKNSLRELIRSTDELAEPSRIFLERFRNTFGISFWDFVPEVRFVLAYGYVDEGLWGLTSQSHYDLNGDLLPLLTRLEKCANAREIILSADFHSQLCLESKDALSGIDVRWEERELKGIGVVRFARVTSIDSQAKKLA